MKQSSKIWDATSYDSKLSFVSELGKSILEHLQPQKGKKVLDLGCGTGDLAAAIHAQGADVLGIDLSGTMIQRAREKYPSLLFQVANAETFRTAEQFDAVFSNAALHWIRQPEKVIETIWLALRPGGRLVAEFGGHGNIQQICKAIARALERRGIDAAKRNPWYFPTIGGYSALLENQGFRVTYAYHFDRPTPLKDGERGIVHWLDMFASAFFIDFTVEERSAAYEEIAADLRGSLFRDGEWVADYSRLQVIAYKA